MSMNYHRIAINELPDALTSEKNVSEHLLESAEGYRIPIGKDNAYALYVPGYPSRLGFLYQGCLIHLDVDDVSDGIAKAREQLDVK